MTSTEPRFDTTRAVIERAVADLEVPSAVAFVGTKEDAACMAATGVTRLEGGVPVTPETVYDLASLTKVVATLPAVLKLVGEGEVGLDDKVRRFFSNAGWFKTPSLGDATVRDLLTHSSGLPAWTPLFAVTDNRRTAFANVLQTPLEHPPGTYTYSDLGFILLGAIIERVSGERQDAFVQRYIFGPLGMTETRYGPVKGEHIAATEDCGWRGGILQGVVHDENAFAMGGVAGHAGLFGTAGDLATYAQAWLRLDPRLGPESLLQDAVREHLPGNERRGLGWMLKSENSSAGRYASERAFGHTGFTGTSLWLDPVGGWFAVLLTNRVHPSREHGRNIHALRVAFHEAVAQELKK